MLTHTKQEIDRIELANQKIQAYEYKWTPHKFKVPTEFAAAYPDSKYNVIDQENYLDYIL